MLYRREATVVIGRARSTGEAECMAGIHLRNDPRRYLIEPDFQFAPGHLADAGAARIYA